MTDSSPEPEFVDGQDWEPPTPKKEVFKTSRDKRALERSSKRTTASSQRKSSGGASQPSRVPLVELLSPSEIQQRHEKISEQRQNARKNSEQLQNARKSWQFDRTSKSTPSALRKKESSSFVFARKPSPSQRSVATQLSSNQSVASSSAHRKRERVSFEYLASNKGDRRITKKIDVHENAAPVLETMKARYQDNAQKQVTSVNNIAMRRNSTGKNPEMNNMFSTLLNIAAGNPKFGEFFDANSPRANQIQNVTAKHNIKRSKLRAFATTAHNMVKQFRKSKNNQFLKQSIMQRPDYGGNHNFLQILLMHCRELHIVVVTDGMDITSENAKKKKIYLVHSLMALGNEEACRQLVYQNNALKSERPDCEHKDCTAAVGTGGGGRYCPDHIPTHCTVSYEDWKRDRYDKMSPLGKSRIKGKSGKKWNETKEDWNGCAAKVSTASSERFLCSRCTETDNALRE